MTLDAAPDFLRTHEAAEVLRTTPGRLAKDRLTSKPIPYTRMGRTILYAKSDLLAYLQANRCAA